MHIRLTKNELVAIAERLLSDHTLNMRETDRLIDEFEANLYPQAAELIYYWRNEFKDLVSLVDFALGQEPVDKLSRDELVTVANKLLTGDYPAHNDIECTRLCRQFRANVPHPDGLDLIYWPKIHFENAADLVDYALSYEPEGGQSS
jgi:hypothetical protein